jgi:hypothetical protein
LIAYSKDEENCQEIISRLNKDNYSKKMRKKSDDSFEPSTSLSNEAKHTPVISKKGKELNQF